MVQTIVRSNRFPDPVFSVWEHRGVRSTGSDHSSIWVWTKTWAVPVRFSTGLMKRPCKYPKCVWQEHVPLNWRFFVIFSWTLSTSGHYLEIVSATTLAILKQLDFNSIHFSPAVLYFNSFFCSCTLIQLNFIAAGFNSTQINSCKINSLKTSRWNLF